VIVPKLFVSYARVNKPAVEELVGHLHILGYETWVDSSIRGGQEWWGVILQAIADCDAFIAVVSRGALNSLACSREFEWAEALAKPVLPVAVESVPGALPARISSRQIVDYSEMGSHAALTLASALAVLPPARALPDPLPTPPAVPLSYLTELVELARQTTALTIDEQAAILDRLELALRSVDSVEQQGARDILSLIAGRPDLAKDSRIRAGQLAETPAVQLVPNELVSANAASVAATWTEADEASEAARLLGADGEEIAVPADGLRIGRMPDNDLVVANPKVSRHHAVIVPTPDGFVIRDLGGPNGTYVGDVRIVDSHLLGHSDLIRIGDRSWTFELIELPEAV
jgi:TIR domain/FHA domain